MRFQNVIEANRVHIIAYRIRNISYQALLFFDIKKHVFSFFCLTQSEPDFFDRASVLPQQIVNVTSALSALEDIFTTWFPFDLAICRSFETSVLSQDFSFHEACQGPSLPAQPCAVWDDSTSVVWDKNKWHCNSQSFSKRSVQKKKFSLNISYLSEFFALLMWKY